MQTINNLRCLWDQRDHDDHTEGLQAYRRYRRVMVDFAEYYGFKIAETTSAFVALSPNSDYHGNLRSLASCMEGVRDGAPVNQITVSTYNACRNRAVSYLKGEVDFLSTVRGLKTRAFRDNILRPNTSRAVTVDGHMISAFHGVNLTMKDASRLMKNRKQYEEISKAIENLADANDIAPCQTQAILWLTRKRVLNVKYNAQLNLFNSRDDKHNTVCRPEDYQPYRRKSNVISTSRT